MITAVKINVSGGHTLALQHGGQNYFLLVSCWTFNSYPPMCFKRYHITFSTFSLKFKCKICVKKEVIHNFKNHTLVTWPATNLLILRKWCRFEKPNHYPLIIFRRQNHITFIFIKTVSHDLLVQMAYKKLSRCKPPSESHIALWPGLTVKDRNI